MNILVLSERWLAGGKENYIVSNIENIKDDSLNICILTGKKESNFFDDRLNKKKVKIIELLDDIYPASQRLFRLNLALKKFLKNNEIDIIHINIDNGLSLNLARVAKKNGVKKIIVHSHNSDLGTGELRFVKLLCHRLGKMLYLKYPTDYWACSDLAAIWMYNDRIINQKNYEVLKNGIFTANVAFSIEKREKYRSLLNVNNDTYIIGTVGRLGKQKNQSFLLDMMLNLKNENNTFKLVIVGEGELLNFLKKKAYSLGIEDSVIFWGKTNDIQGLLSAMDIFLLPSLFEGLPLSAVEAQANGLPTILSQNITKQTELTTNVFFESIDDIDSWIRIIQEKKYVNNRKKYKKIIQKQGFDIVDTAEKFQTLLSKI